jgi:TRAP-type C4-dicarboxylate transport system substrate-binding protein
MNPGFRRTAIILFCAVLMIALPLSAIAQSKIRLATLAPRGTVYHQALQAMGEKWSKAPGGGVALTVYTDGNMGNEAAMVQRMRIGQIQAALLTTIGMSEIDQSVTALQNMPMMFRTVEEVQYVRGQLRAELEKKFLDKGFVILCWGDTGWVRFFSKRPAVKADDFKAMKLFVTAGDQKQVDIMLKAGYHPVPLDWTDALTGLQTGMVDAVPTAPIVALAGQYYTVTKNMLDVKWAPLAGGLVMTRKAWDALPAGAREQVKKAAEEAGLEIERRSREEEGAAIEAMKKRGLQVQSLNNAQEADWRKTAEAFYPIIRGNLVPAEMFDKVQSLLAQYRANGGKGTK